MSEREDDTGNKWKVAVVDQTFSECLHAPSRLVRLADPNGQTTRQYIVANADGSSGKSNENNNSSSKAIVEIQSVPSDFCSFLVGRHVVREGSLHLCNAVDPLFFLLATSPCDTSNTKTTETKDGSPKKVSWQPTDQIISGLSSDIQGAIVESQLEHLHECLRTEQTDNVPYWKFSQEKALKWLQMKQDRVFKCLLRQEIQRKQQEASKSAAAANGKQGGSVSTGFNMPVDSLVSAAKPNPHGEVTSLATTLVLKHESIQIVCNYLTRDWMAAFLAVMETSEDRVWGRSSGKENNGKQCTHSSAPVALVANETPVKRKEIPRGQTMANKQLAKVNKKGMKSLTSFFGAPKPKKSKTQ